MLPTSRSNLWRLIGLYLFSFLVMPLLALLALEAFTRILCPEINHQDTERSLFAQRHDGQSLGWSPGAKGMCFGLPAEIDQSGHRLMWGPPQWKNSWLILGDSVTFGVGVETEKTFVGLLQSAFPTVKMWNTSVVGYNIENYKQVLLNFDLAKQSVSKVLLFYCLNDAEDAVATVSNPVGGERVFAFLRRHSKFYMLLKGDGSSHDIGDNWSYILSEGSGEWKDGEDLRFKYEYDTGQWWDKSDYGDWAKLGPTSLSSSVMGDGANHQLGTDWSYSYNPDSQGGSGTWSDGQVSFIYNYTDGHWWGYDKYGSTYYDTRHYGSQLDSNGFSAAFIGDGEWHNIGSIGDGSWMYRYDLAEGHLGYWQNDSGLTQYKYSYGNGQWYHEGTYGDWSTLGADGQSSRFIGDGSYHDAGTSWYYFYNSSDDTVIFQIILTEKGLFFHSILT